MPKKRTVRKQSPLAIAAVLCVVVAALYLAQDVLVPMVLSVMLAFLLARPVSWLERRGFGRVSSVISVVAVAFVLIGILGYVVGRQAVSLADNLENYQKNINAKVGRLRGTGAGIGHTFEKLSKEFNRASEIPATTQTTTAPAEKGVVTNAAEDISSDPARVASRELAKGPPATAPSTPGSTPANPLYTVPQSQPVSPIQTLLTYLGVIAGPLGTAGLVVVFVVFILLEREALRDRFIAVTSRGNYTVTTRAINDAAERISRYLVAQSIVNGTYGLTIGVGLFLIGVSFGNGVWFPSVVLWALLCALLRFIPYVGPAMASLFPIVVATAVYPGFTVVIAVITLFVVIELISNNVMEPWLYGASTGLSTVAILVAAIFWTWLWGSVGLLLATPLTVCIAVIGKHIGSLNFLYVLLGDEEALPAYVGFYQRLLAGDRVDAERVAKRVLDAEGPEAVADRVYFPAIRMARRDRADAQLTAEAETRIFEQTLSITCPTRDTKVTSTQAATEKVHVLACPSHHYADEITLNVLAEVLACRGLVAHVMSTRALTSDIETAIERNRPDFVVIGVMPPGGLPQTRYLCRRLRKRFPELHILVTYWGRPRNFDRLLVRLRRAGASYVLTSLEQTTAQISAMLPGSPAALPATDPAAARS